MRIRFDNNDTAAVCVGAFGCFVLSFLFTEQAAALAEIIRLTCVAAVGFGLYFRQNTRINELETDITCSCGRHNHTRNIFRQQQIAEMVFSRYNERRLLWKYRNLINRR